VVPNGRAVHLGLPVSRGAVFANQDSRAPPPRTGPLYRARYRSARRYPVRFKLRRVQREHCGGRRVPLFTRMDLRFPKHKPSYAHRLTRNRLFCAP